MQVWDVNGLWAVSPALNVTFKKTVWFILTVLPARCKEFTTEKPEEEDIKGEDEEEEEMKEENKEEEQVEGEKEKGEVKEGGQEEEEGQIMTEEEQQEVEKEEEEYEVEEEEEEERRRRWRRRRRRLTGDRFDQDRYIRGRIFWLFVSSVFQTPKTLHIPLFPQCNSAASFITPPVCNINQIQTKANSLY